VKLALRLDKRHDKAVKLKERPVNLVAPSINGNHDPTNARIAG
jgi:hypothetical protein